MQVPDYGFLILPRWVTKDMRLSMEARGLWSMMHGFGGTWQFRKVHLQKLAACGRSKFERMVQELIALEYLSIDYRRGPDGRVDGCTYVLNPTPPLPEMEEDGSWGGDDDGSDAELTAAQTVEFEAMRAARQAAAASLGPAMRKVAQAATKAAKAARSQVSEDAESAKTPANDRNPENQCSGENEAHRDAGFPAAGKPVPLDNIKDNKKTPLPPSDSAPAAGVAEDAGEGVPGEIDHEQLAHQWAPAVSRGAAYAKAHVRPETAQAMLRLGLTTEEKLRRTGIRF